MVDMGGGGVSVNNMHYRRPANGEYKVSCLFTAALLLQSIERPASALIKLLKETLAVLCVDQVVSCCCGQPSLHH